jgi:hypothetical protein
VPLELATGIASWLRARQSFESGRVIDSAHQVPGTYADGFAALVFSLLGWPEPRARALQVSLKRGPDSEFDSLAQALILQLAPESVSEEERLSLTRQPLYHGSALVSNNWALFRALTRTLRGQLVPDFSAIHKQLPSGLFPDSPVGVATPVCYHAKMCATLALLESFRPQAMHRQALDRGLRALLSLVSPQGVLVPYGRSRNTLFAYGSAYLAFRLGARLLGEGHYGWAASALLAHMTKFQDPDGHIPATLNRNEWLRQDWDIYINNPDYNAFAAACLLIGDRLGVVDTGAAPGPETVDLGPLLVCRRSDAYFACSTTGEFAPYGSPFFCDTRYAGLVPLLFDDSQRMKTFDENYCWDGRDRTRGALVDPRISDWIPYLELNRQNYWVRLYGAITWSLEEDVLRVAGSGLPLACKPIPRWRRFFTSRLSSRPVPQMVHQHLTTLMETTLQCNFSQPAVTSQSSFPSSQSILRRGWLEEKLCPT